MIWLLFLAVCIAGITLCVWHDRKNDKREYEHREAWIAEEKKKPLWEIQIITFDGESFVSGPSYATWDHGQFAWKMTSKDWARSYALQVMNEGHFCGNRIISPRAIKETRLKEIDAHCQPS